MEFKILLIIVLSIILIYNVYPDLFSNILKNNINTENFDQSNVQNQQNKLNNINGVTDDDLNIPYKYKNATYGDNYFIGDGGNGTLGLTSNLCSKSCCSPQYPLPFSMPVDPLLCNSGQEYIPTSYTCNNGLQDTGCLCMTKEQAIFLGSRGGNT